MKVRIHHIYLIPTAPHPSSLTLFPPSLPKTGEARTRKEVTSSSMSLCDSKREDLRRTEPKPSPLMKNKQCLSKQLSMCETSREIAWERRRRQILRQERGKNGIFVTKTNKLTDEDLHELKGCIELGFGFEEEQGQNLCNTLPALDLYFAINRQISTSPDSSPLSSFTLSSFESPRREPDWKICNPGDNPQQVKTKLRHWAQAVACVVMQSY